MENLADLLKLRLSSHNLSASAHSAQILLEANRLLPSLLKGMPVSVKAYRLEQTRLYVSADNAVLAQELWGIQAQLLKKLQASHGEKAVSKIIIKWFDPSDGLRVNPDFDSH
jgi:hypothetical protein